MREAMLIFHFIGLAMGLGTSFSHAFLGIAAAKMSPDEAIKFRMHSLVLGKMGNIGMGLLLVSGFYLITPYWSTFMSTPLLIAKLTLVLILVILIVVINDLAKKAAKGDAVVYLTKMGQVGRFTLLIALAIVILAVSIFH